MENNNLDKIAEPYKFAGIGIRVAAFIMDVIILAFVIMIILAPTFNLLKQYINDEIFLFLIKNTTYLIVFAYFTIPLITKWNGTIGMNIFDIKIINQKGRQINLFTAILRYIILVIILILCKSILILIIIQVLVGLIDQNKRDIHD